jgi:phage head maturation protease
MSERNPVEYRSAVVADVSFPKRTIELVVMPYEEETTVEHQGRMVREVISRGAFDGIEGRPNRVKVNLDHDITRSLGKVLRFHPSRQVGLVADCYISPTAAGNDALQYAADGIYDASAGFAPIEQRWEQGGGLRRVNKAWLAHIALVSRGPRTAFCRHRNPEPGSDPSVAVAGELRSSRSLNYLPS